MEMSPTTRYTLRRNTASIMNIRFDFLRRTNRQVKCKTYDAMLFFHEICSMLQVKQAEER